MPAAPEAHLICPVCRQPVTAADYEGHLRHSHQLITYRGAYRARPEALDAIRDDLASPGHAEEAWQALLRLARDLHGPDPDAFLAEQLTLTLTGLLLARQAEVIPTLASVLPADRPSLAAALSDRPEPEARLLGLAFVARLPLPLPPAALFALRRLLLDRRLPDSAALAAAAALLARGADQALAGDLLAGLTAGLGKSKAIARLRKLEKLTGGHPAIDARFQEAQGRVRMTCPRCGIQLRRAEMEPHLWNEHRLVLENLRVRDPWAVVEEWLDQGLIDRARVAAPRIDPAEGTARLQRLLYARRIADPPTRQALLTRARHQQATCCPWCYALLPAPRPGATPGLAQRGNQLLLGGYRVAITEGGLRPQLLADTPEGPIYRGPEPDQTWTMGGAQLVYAGSMIVAAFGCAWLWPRWAGAPIVPVTAFLLLAGVTALGVRVVWRRWPPARERLFDHAWQVVAPRLHAKGFSAGDATFLAGLARLASRTGRRDIDADLLARFVRLTEQALERGQAVPGHLAELVRLHIEIGTERGEDPVPKVVRWVTRCFEGMLPLYFAQQLLEDWAAPWWGPVELARLRVMLCDRAFEAGFEVQTLLDIGHNAPALGSALVVESPRSLAALRLVWSLRPTRPWDRMGDVQTVFEVAATRDGAATLRDHQALLLRQQLEETPIVLDGSDERMGPARVAVTLAGVWVQEALFSAPPRVFEVRGGRGGSTLVLGNKLFRSPGDLEPLARLLEKWFRYVFHELLPAVDRALTWETPHRAALLRAWGAVGCPECGQYLMPRAGEVGVAVEAEKA